MAKENVRTRAKKKQAAALLQSNRLDEARTLYARICEIDPLDADARFQLGVINMQQGDLQGAEECMRRALDLEPDRAETYFNLGYVVATQGRNDAALALYRDGLKIQPGFAIAHSNMGLIFEGQGDLDQAVACYREAVRLGPVPEAHNNLGNVLRYLGRVDEALTHYQSALRIKPDFFDALYNLGNLLAELRRLDEALPYLQKTVAIRADAKTLFNLGSAYLQQAKLQEAVACYSQSLRLDPQQADTYLNLGTTFAQLGNNAEAFACYREALKIKPDYVDVLCNIGELLISDGRLDEALADFRQALRGDPSHLKSRIGEIKVLDRLGDFEQAFALLQPLLSEERVSALAALAYASLCRHVGRCADAVTLMERVLARGVKSLDSYQHVSLHFELGRLLDAAGEYDRAFEHYRQANALKREVFSPEGYARHIDDVVATYNHDFMAKAPRAGNDSARPVFIVGMPRSGTSLVEQILASHPQVAGGGELTAISDIARGLPALLGTAESYPQCLAALTVDACERMSRQYLDVLAAISSDARYVTDKMPGNFKFLGLIALLFPGARIIHCRRDPLDTCLSCYFQHFSPGHSYAYDLDHLGSYYRQYQRLMQHWRSVLTLPVLEVRYEDLVADQERVSRELIAFCDLPWDERCLHFHETGRVVHTRSYDQVRQPLYQRSVGRWHHYDRFLEPLKRRLSGQA